MKLQIGLANKILLPHITYIIILCVKSKSYKSQTVKKLWVGTIVTEKFKNMYGKQNLLKRNCIFCGTGKKTDKANVRKKVLEKKTKWSGCNTLSQRVNSSLIEGIKSLMYNNY